MGRTPCCDNKIGLKKGPWTPEEDKILVDYIQANGYGSWRSLPKLAGLQRCGKSCRLRWINYLRPDIKRGPFTEDEQKSIIQLHRIVGNKWATIAQQLPGRTDNEIKNYWHTHLKKHPIHMAQSSLSISLSSPSSHFSAARHMAQWESARLEAEARLSSGSLSYHASQSEKEHADFFLRIWDSDIGESFRKKDDQNITATCTKFNVKVDENEEDSPPLSSSALTVSEMNGDSVKCGKSEEVETESKSSIETDEDETFRFCLDLAAGDDDLSFAQNRQMESCYSSFFFSDLNALALLGNGFD